MTVKLSGRLPEEGTDDNGLRAIEKDLITNPGGRHLLLAVVECDSQRISFTEDGEVVTPTAGICLVEPILNRPDVLAAVDVMARARAKRIDTPQTLGDAAAQVAGALAAGGDLDGMTFDVDMDGLGRGLRAMDAQREAVGRGLVALEERILDE
jgi:hypothetical protein